MVRQVPFTEYEAVLLLDAFLNTLSGAVTRREAIQDCSDALRHMAVNKGIEIDDIYRNTNGIAFQMASMESAYRGRTLLKPASKLFAETVEMYISDRKKYERMLKEVKLMAEDKSNHEELFMQWLSKNVSPAQLSELYMAFREIEQYAKKMKMIERSLYENIDVALVKRVRGSIEQSKIFKFTHKKQMGKINSALNYLIQYTQEGLKLSEITSETVLADVIEAEPDIVLGSNIFVDKPVEKIVDIVRKEERDEQLTNSVQKSDKKYTSTNKEAFYLWLLNEQHMAQVFCKGYVLAVREAERFAVEHGFPHTKLLEVSAEEAKETADMLFSDAEFIKKNEKLRNRFQMSITKLLAYYGVEWTAPERADPAVTKMIDRPVCDMQVYEIVLEKYFPRGYRLGSAIEMKRFRRYYEELNGIKLVLENELAEGIIRQSGIEYAGRVYAPQTMIDDDLRGKIFEYVERNLAEGKTALYFEAIFREFSEEFLEHNIYDANMLKTYISYIARDKYYIDKSYLSSERRSTDDSIEEVRTCLKEYGLPMKVEELCGTLSHIPSERIKMILGTNLEFVRNGKGEYFHADVLALSDEELENISLILDAEIELHEYISGNELYDALINKYLYLKERNTAFSVIGWRDALKYKMGDQYSFSGNIISAKGKNLSMSDVFANFAREQDEFTLQELLAFAENMGSVVYFDALYEYAARISHEQFIKKNTVKFHIKETDEVLDRFCTGAYLAIPRIEDFGIFPEASHPWTTFLLEHYLACRSERYYLMHSGYNQNAVVGAMVKKECIYTEFDELTIDVLAESGVELKKEAALKYLSDNGYIARKSYANIEALLIRTREKRNKREN